MHNGWGVQALCLNEIKYVHASHDVPACTACDNETRTTVDREQSSTSIVQVSLVHKRERFSVDLLDPRQVHA